ncbi:MAG: periplasmic binding domain protein [Mycobacterium sp.]|nr:periplasmic binding domain protein [Mycobacterium sp.]
MHGQIACQGGIFAVLLLAGATACTGHGGMGTFGNPGELPIALNVPLTGAGAPFGIPPKCAWEVVTEEYNRAGGLEVGGKRYPIKLVVDDNKWDPTVTRSAIEKEVYKDKVAVVKTVGDPGDPIIVPVTEDAGVLLIDSTGNKQFLKEPYRFVVGTWPSPNLIGKPFFNLLLKQEPKIKSAYHVAFDLQFDRNNAAWAQQSLTGLGVEWKGDAFYQAGAVDFASIVAPAIQANPDVIVLGSLGGDAPAIVSTLRQLGYHGVIASDVASQSLENVVKGAGANAADGMYQAELSTYPGSKELENYRRAYESKCSGDWDAAQGVLFWTEAKFTLEAIKNSGAIDKPDAILKAMAHTTVETPFVAGSPMVVLGGEAEYGRPRELTTPIALNQFKDGEYRTIAVLDYTK